VASSSPSSCGGRLWLWGTRARLFLQEGSEGSLALSSEVVQVSRPSLSPQERESPKLEVSAYSSSAPSLS